MRLGLFGGTFNPIHIGHLRAAVEVWEAFRLDKVLLIPSAHPPHKDVGEVAGAEDRLAMVRLAVNEVPFLEASDVELNRHGPSYTIETLKHFRSRLPDGSALYFILGVDAFSEITTWKSYTQLFAVADFIVMTRPKAAIKDLESFINEHISGAYRYNEASRDFSHPELCRIHPFDITHLDISATDTRERIRQGRSIRFLVPNAVEALIKTKGLYR
ncbi:MAG: nicotinate-nucleotide adenylyltransferase [Deltaproteobacteria bacterium]|nr:nicotinate-nucleotide adenylyltransferase [Deltaproteobacteria bacterium]